MVAKKNIPVKINISLQKTTRHRCHWESFSLMVTSKPSMSYVYISDVECVPNFKVIFFSYGNFTKKQKDFALYCYHFANLEGHAVHALFSPVSLPAT